MTSSRLTGLSTRIKAYLHTLSINYAVPHICFCPSEQWYCKVVVGPLRFKMSLEQVDVSNNYFVCTLGEAPESSSVFSGLETVTDFVEYQARTWPEIHAVGFPEPREQEQDWGFELLSESCVQESHLYSELTFL
jgi:hypothetical protein